MIKGLLNCKISKWYFYKYFGIPKDKEIFKIQKTAIHYWKDRAKEIAICREYGQPLMRIKPIVGFLSEPERGATDTSSVNNKDASLISGSDADNNFGSLTNLHVRSHATDIYRFIIHFTLPAGSGTISDVKLYTYENYSFIASGTANIHQLTQTGWTEAGVTWNKYDGSNAWATAGGDFNATVIDAITVGDADGWHNWVLMGTGADNPLTLNWEDNVHLLIKINNEGLSERGGRFNSKEAVSNKPYLEITYTTAAVGKSQGMII
jgi:hypothetical protein